MKNILGYGLVILLLVSCGSNKSFTEQDYADYQFLKEMIASQSFEIVSNFAAPKGSAAYSRVANSGVLGPGNSANTIDISSNPNKLTVSGNTIKGYFPYFGEQTFGSGYGSSSQSGIDFDGVPEDYQVDYNDRKQTATIVFKIRDENRNNETYSVTITLFKNNRSVVRILSPFRTSIDYLGRVSALMETK